MAITRFREGRCQSGSRFGIRRRGSSGAGGKLRGRSSTLYRLGSGIAAEDILAAMPAAPEAERVETGTVDVGGIETFYRRIPGDGPPAVFVHGVPTHSEDWMPVLEQRRAPRSRWTCPASAARTGPRPIASTTRWEPTASSSGTSSRRWT